MLSAARAAKSKPKNAYGANRLRGGFDGEGHSGLPPKNGRAPCRTEYAANFHISSIQRRAPMELQTVIGGAITIGLAGLTGALGLAIKDPELLRDLVTRARPHLQSLLLYAIGLLTGVIGASTWATPGIAATAIVFVFGLQATALVAMRVAERSHLLKSHGAKANRREGNDDDK